MSDLNQDRLDQSQLPAHIAIIMDGNGRWAQAKGISRTEGHREGSKAVRKIVKEASRLGIHALTLYAFSEQNWDRPLGEVQSIMTLLQDYILGERQELIENKIRLKSIGRIDKLPAFVRKDLEDLIEETSHFKKATLTLALSYGGKEEIADTTKQLVEKAKNGHLNIEDINESLIEKHLPSMQVGPVDLLIRTGGEQRISNFLLWGAAYAEFYFTETLWPDFDEENLKQAISTFQNRERRFGKLNKNQDHNSLNGHLLGAKNELLNKNNDSNDGPNFQTDFERVSSS